MEQLITALSVLDELADEIDAFNETLPEALDGDADEQTRMLRYLALQASRKRAGDLVHNMQHTRAVIDALFGVMERIIIDAERELNEELDRLDKVIEERSLPGDN